MNNYSRHWTFTWEINSAQKKLPSEQKLEAFLNVISDMAQFQKERGKKKGKLHYQGYFEISGGRCAKKDILSLFQKEFRNCKGLTIQKVFSVEAILAYTSKQATRDSPTVYCGKQELYNVKYQNLLSKPWQVDLFVFLKMIKNEIELGEEGDTERLRIRSLIWLEDVLGGSGKSQFIKWLRAGQKELVCRLMPIESVDRISHAMVLLTKSRDIDIIMIDDTKTKGEGTSFKNMFEAIEKIKNGYIVSTMYGTYKESIYEYPTIIFFTNRKIQDYSGFLSKDRWYHMKITKNFFLEKRGWIDGDFWEKYFSTLPDGKPSNVLAPKDLGDFRSVIDTNFSE